MKPIDEIRLTLCFLITWFLIPLCIEKNYISNDDISGFWCLILVCMLGIITGWVITDFLITFKKWWKE